MVLTEDPMSKIAEEIERILVAADVSTDLAEELKSSILKSTVDDVAYSPGNYSRCRKIFLKAISGEVLKLLDQRSPPFVPEKSKSSIVMFVGLPGSGKTTTCPKYAQLHQEEGFKAAIVSADTLAVGAFSQIKDFLGEDSGVFCFGSSTEHDAAKVALEGIEASRKQNCDLIVLDTSGCGKQDDDILDAVRKVAKAANPDLVVLVWDCSIGQAAYEQAAAFKENFNVGAVILTKTDGSAKGGSALSAVVATQSPVTFIGTGTQLDALKEFDGEEYISRLLGIRMMGSPKSPEASAARFLICTLMSESFKKGLSEAGAVDVITHPPEILMELFAKGWNFGITQDVSLADASVPVAEIEAAGYQAGLLAESLNRDGLAEAGLAEAPQNADYRNLFILWASAGLYCGCYLKRLGFTGSL